ncbi:MAG: nidogen-like domain-containing protein, partial [Reyranella sp.]
MSTSLVNGLGGDAGFGEMAMPRLDDTPSLLIDLSAVMPGGLNFFGAVYTSLYLNYNGSVTFGTPLEVYTPTAITASTSIPIIAPYWADADTRSGTVAASPGGTSTGSNLVWYDLDAASHTFTATWDDVGYFDQNLDRLNAFQIRLIAIGTNGDFDIEFRYETINWTTGDASGGAGGLLGDVAVAGYSSGDGENFFQLQQSGNQAAMLGLPGDSNVATPGLFTFSVRQGMPIEAHFSIVGANTDGSEGQNGMTPLTFTVSLDGDISVERTVSYSVMGSGDQPASADDFVGGTLPFGTLTFAAEESTKTITVLVQGDTSVEADETFEVALSNPTGGATLGIGSATGTIRNDDARIDIVPADADHAEGNAGDTAFTFTVTRFGDSSVEHTVAYAVTGSGDQAAAPDDFAGSLLPSGTITFAVGETAKTITVAV